MGLKETLDEENKEREFELLVAAERGEKVATLLENDGWKIFEEEMMYRLKDTGNALQKAGDEKEIFRLQGRMGEVNYLLSFVENAIETGKEARKEIENKGVE